MTAGRPTHRKLRHVPAKFTPGFLDSLDLRFEVGAVAKRIYNELVTALGGQDSLSPQRLLLVERVVWTHIALQKLEVEFATTTKLDLNGYGQLVHVLVSLLRTLGLNRVPVNVPSLHEYLEPRRKDA